MTSAIRHRSLALLCLTTLCLVAPRTAAAVGSLENPGDGSFASGIGLFSGWHCDANRITIRIDDLEPIRAAYGTARGDTESVCGDSDNGFVLLFNYSLFGDGEHTAVALADGVEFGRATFTVTTFGTSFLRDADDGTYTITDFPADGASVTLQWQQGAQNFVMTDRTGSAAAASVPPPEEDRVEPSAAQGPGSLELPAAGSSVSGIGLFSGWFCDADKIEVRIDSGPLFEAGYGTARGDTEGICGDSNNGFGLLFNYNLFGDGPHTAIAYADGVEFARASFTVTTLGSSFARGLERSQVLGAFPELGSNIVVTWQQGAQNFVVTDVGDAQSLVEAGDFAKSIGIGAYALRIDDEADPPISVEVRTPLGGILGQVTLDSTGGGALWRFVGNDSAERTLAIQVIAEGNSIETRTILTAKGRQLVQIVETGATGQPVRRLVLETALPGGADVPSVGETRPEGGGTTAFLVLVHEGENLTTDQQLWFEETGLGALAADPGAAYLAATAADPNLASALVLRGNAIAPSVAPLTREATAATGSNPLDKACRPINPETGPGFACCNLCLLGPDLIGPLAPLYNRFCACCGSLTRISAVYVAACVKRFQEGEWTDERCRQEQPPPDPGFKWEVAPELNQCVQRCDESLCRAYCDNVVGAPPPTNGESCTYGVSCDCPVPAPEAYCRGKHPDTFCGRAILNQNGSLVACENAVCGDRTLQKVCPEHPELEEICEPESSSELQGCQGSTVSCADDCKSCQTCECTSDRDCPSSERCDVPQCQCEPRPESCAVDPEDQLKRGHCDPRTPRDGACARGLVCDAATCRCKAQGTCGDGTCDAASGEQTPSGQTSCPQDCAASCGDGKCNIGAGERDFFSDNYCPGDCPQNQCCADTGGCPSEEPFSCPGSCCCCPAGNVCRFDAGWTCGF